MKSLHKVLTLDNGATMGWMVPNWLLSSVETFPSAGLVVFSDHSKVARSFSYKRNVMPLGTVSLSESLGDSKLPSS